MIYYGFFLAIVYILYVSFESFSGIARYGGFKIGAISIGVSIQNQVLSLNRFLGFLIAPLVGLYSDLGAAKMDIFYIGFFGSIFGGIILVFIYIRWIPFTIFFVKIAKEFMDNGYNLKSLKNAIIGKSDIILPKIKKINYNYLIAQLITTGLAMPAVFILNMLAIKYPMYSSALVQSSTVISGFGNLVLNFYTYPHLSVQETKGNVDDCYYSIFLGKIFGMLILSPFLLLVGIWL